MSHPTCVGALMLKFSHLWIHVVSMMAVVLFLQLYNAPTGIAAAYLDTMQGLMQKAVHDDHRLTESQVLMLVIEGVVVGGIAVLLVWFCAAQVGYWTTQPSSSIVMYLLKRR